MRTIENIMSILIAAIIADVLFSYDPSLGNYYEIFVFQFLIVSFCVGIVLDIFNVFFEKQLDKE